MPFTFSHPTYLLPFRSILKDLSPTALIVGSMVPDFEFFLKMKVGENIGHHPWGIVLFDIPVGLLLCMAFHAWVKAPLIRSLPCNMQGKFAGYAGTDWGNYLKENPIRVLCSLLLGLSSHLFLDGFTHFDGWALELLPVLSADLSVWGITAPVFYLLQVGTSILGLFGAFCFYKNLPSTSITPTSRSPYIQQVLFLSVITLGVRAMLLPEHLSFWDIVMAVFGSLIYSMLILGMLYKGLDILVKKQNRGLADPLRHGIYSCGFLDFRKVYLLDFGSIHHLLLKPLLIKIHSLLRKLRKRV